MAIPRESDDLRTQKTRSAICQAFIQLLHEMDFNSISIALLMKRSGYSRGAFYLHYQNVWDVFEEIIHAYVKDLCAGFEVEHNSRFTMDEQAYLIVLNVVKAVKKWHPLGLALLKKRGVPDILPDAVEQFAWKNIDNYPLLFPAAGVNYVEQEGNDSIARETAMRYCVACLTVMFESAAQYVTPNMTHQEMTQLAEKIYAGNVGWWSYESRMELHPVKWHPGLDQ